MNKQMMELHILCLLALTQVTCNSFSAETPNFQLENIICSNTYICLVLGAVLCAVRHTVFYLEPKNNFRVHTPGHECMGPTWKSQTTMYRCLYSLLHGIT